MTPERNRYPAVTQRPPLRALTKTSIAAGRLLAAGAEVRVTMPLLLPAAGGAALIALARNEILRRRTPRRAGHSQMNPPVSPLVALGQALRGPGGHLVGRQDRDAVLDLLAVRYASEHLDDDQYEERHTIAWQARTRRDLRTAVRGLPW